MITAFNKGVAHRDFFAYCTTLRPLELKALGELSYVQHLAPQRIIYAQGGASTAIYIITRGTVELSTENAVAGGDSLLLSRGDLLGDIDTLTKTPRRHTARARGAVTVQCFQVEDFPELARRAPSFFLFLSQNLASRLRAELDATDGDSEPLQLHGNLANFDLVTVYQTIVSSRQTGELRIFNEKAELISVFFFEQGQPRHGQFQHLTGPEAFMQLFVSDTLSGTFLFSSEGRVSSCVEAELIAGSADDMLIHALQARDELQQLKLRFPDAGATLHRRRLALASDTPVELPPAAEQVWAVAFNNPLPIGALSRRTGLSEIRVYEAVDLLVQSGHFELCSTAACADVA